MNTKLYKRLLDFEIKPSMQRIAVMKYLLEHKTHPSAEEVYHALVSTLPTLSKTTVYNTLKLLAHHGAALMLTIDDKTVRFDGDITPHAHFLCSECGKVYDIKLHSVKEEVDKIELDGHQVLEIHSYYRGICKQCRLLSKN